MNAVILQAIPLASQDRLQRHIEYLARGFQDNKTDVNSGNLTLFLAVLAAIIAALWLLAHFMERREGRARFDSSLGLFLSLAKEHGLTWRETWLLWRVARHQGLKAPARLFLEPERFAKDRLAPAFATRMDLLRAMARRLFADLKTDELPRPAGGRKRDPARSAKSGPGPGPPLGCPVDQSPSLDAPPLAGGVLGG